MDRLPNFFLHEYVNLLSALAENGYVFRPVSRMKHPGENRCVYLRHDIDFSLSAALPMAEKEAELGCSATYFVLISGGYNVFSRENSRAMAELSRLGHEIGLHYDLQMFPPDPHEAELELQYQAGILQRLSGQPIKSIVMHNPCLGGRDWFQTCDEFVHPHDTRRQGGLLYVSDSCRAWRDESLLSCFSSDPPENLLLSTHPELWMDGTIHDRMEYIRKVLVPHVVEKEEKFFLESVAPVWENHIGPIQHDQRIRQRKEP